MPILISTERQRLLQTVVYFASNVRALGKIKLFKLLYLFDFEHFRQTGKSATGLDYQAWKFGPVPIELMEEWEALSDDLAALVHIEPQRIIDYERHAVLLNEGVTFDEGLFSPRQLRILRELADQYRTVLSGTMIDVTHAQNGAWARTWRGGSGQYRPIDYALAIGDEEPNAAALREVAEEQSMYRAALVAARHAEPD